jgi:hypothetical protein
MEKSIKEVKLSFRLTEVLKSKITQISTKENKSISKIIEEILNNYFDFNEGLNYKFEGAIEANYPKHDLIQKNIEEDEIPTKNGLVLLCFLILLVLFFFKKK